MMKVAVLILCSSLCSATCRAWTTKDDKRFDDSTANLKLEVVKLDLSNLCAVVVRCCTQDIMLERISFNHEPNARHAGEVEACPEVFPDFLFHVWVFIILLALLQLPCRVCLESGDRRYRRCKPRLEVGPEVSLECFRQRKLTSFVTLEISEWFQGLMDIWAWTLGLCHTLSYFVHFGHFGSLKDGQWRVYHDNHSDCDAPWLRDCISHASARGASALPGGRRRPHQGQKPHRRQRQWPQPRLPQLQFRQPRLPPRPPGWKKTCLRWHHWNKSFIGSLCHISSWGNCCSHCAYVTCQGHVVSHNEHFQGGRILDAFTCVLACHVWSVMCRRRRT